MPNANPHMHANPAVQRWMMDEFEALTPDVKIFWHISHNPLMVLMRSHIAAEKSFTDLMKSGVDIILDEHPTHSICS